MAFLSPESHEACLSYLCRRYAQAPGEAEGLLVTYQLFNLDPYNALEIGSLSVPLVFQVMPVLDSAEGACQFCEPRGVSSGHAMNYA